MSGNGSSVKVHGTARPLLGYWFNYARDAVHLHWMTTCEDPIPVLLSLGAKAARGVSITWDGAMSYDNTMELLKQAEQYYMLCWS